MIRRILSWLGIMAPEHRAIYAALCRQYGKKKRPSRRQPTRAQAQYTSYNTPPGREVVK